MLCHPSTFNHCSNPFLAFFQIGQIQLYQIWEFINLFQKIVLTNGSIFHSLILHQKTVIAVLDNLINPDWPYIPVEDENEMESEWRKVPDIPVRYHFFYRILDGDDEGRPPKIYDEDLKKEVENEKFNHRSTSCLQALCESGHSEVRQMVLFYYGVSSFTTRTKFEHPVFCSFWRKSFLL